jgi:hypothetical protein
MAEDILSGRISLDGYPFRYVCLTISPSTALGSAFKGRAGANNLLDHVLSAAELLEGHGWELTSVDNGGTMVYLRRRA